MSCSRIYSIQLCEDVCASTWGKLQADWAWKKESAEGGRREIEVKCAQKGAFTLDADSHQEWQCQMNKCYENYILMSNTR